MIRHASNHNISTCNGRPGRMRHRHCCHEHDSTQTDLTFTRFATVAKSHSTRASNRKATQMQHQFMQAATASRAGSGSRGRHTTIALGSPWLLQVGCGLLDPMIPPRTSTSAPSICVGNSSERYATSMPGGHLLAGRWNWHQLAAHSSHMPAHSSHMPAHASTQQSHVTCQHTAVTCHMPHGLPRELF